VGGAVDDAIGFGGGEAQGKLGDLAHLRLQPAIRYEFPSYVRPNQCFIKNILTVLLVGYYRCVNLVHVFRTGITRIIDDRADNEGAKNVSHDWFV
jgi:hypothetical protein